jgi:tRNA (cmo5U34)-methyltransferase
MCGDEPKDHLFLEPAQGAFRFDERTARVFDDMIRRSVPFYEEIQRMIGEISREFAVVGSRVYDLGCATGSTLLALDPVLEQNIAFVGLDDSPDMLAQASNKRSAFGSTRDIQFRIADLHQNPEVENASVVILNLTLQFIRPLSRLPLIRQIHQGMREQSCLILVEKHQLPDRDLDQLYTRYYHDLKRRQGYSDSEIAHKREALENVLIPWTREQNCALLREGGFDRGEEFFRWYNFAGFMALRQT